MNNINKKLLIVGLLFILFNLSALLINILFNKTLKYNSLIIDKKEWNNIIKDKVQYNDLKVTNLRFNDYNLYEGEDSTLYYSLIEGNSNSYNPTIKYNNKIKILNKKITNDLISNNENIKLLVYNKNYYKIYTLKCTTLPLINIEYDGSKTINKEKNTSMNFMLYDNRENATQRLIKSIGEIHSRGASSLVLPQKSYKISLKMNSLGNNKRNNNVSLLGMRKDDDWILYSPYNEPSKARNVIASNIWYDCCSKNNKLGVDNGIQYKYVELFFNNKYWGLYALGFPIDEKQLKIGDEDFLYKKVDGYPSEVEITDYSSKKIFGYELKNKIRDENIGWELLNRYYKNILENKKEVKNIIDIDNSIDFFMFINIIQGTDTFMWGNNINNFYISLKKNNNEYTLLYTPWDLDSSIGRDFYNCDENEIVCYKYDKLYNVETILNPLNVLKNDNSIELKIKRRYKDLRKETLSDNNIIKNIDLYEKQIYDSGAFKRNEEKWPYASYKKDEHKLQRIKEYLLKRLKYLDEFYS